MENLLSLGPLATAVARKTLSKALGYSAAMQEESGGWSRLRGEFPAESEPTSWAVMALSNAVVEPERQALGIEFMLRDQSANGSWSGNSAHTAFVVLALASVGTGKEQIRKGVEYLRGVQDGEGGFARLGTEGAPLAVYTANVLNGLKAAGISRDDTMVRKALDWLLSCQNEDGGFGMAKGTDSLALSTAWSIKALRNFGLVPAEPAVRRAAGWLLDRQYDSGGFSNRASAAADAEITSLAIMAVRTLPEHEQIIERAVSYLGSAQNADGSFTGNTPMQFKGESKKNTQTTLFVAWALGELCRRP